MCPVSLSALHVGDMGAHVDLLTEDLHRRGSVLQAGSMALSAVVGAFTNTALVMGLIALLFRDAYAAAQGIPAEAVLGFILGIVAANGVPEAIVAAILVPAVCIPMGKALKLNRAPLAAREPA